MIIVEIAISTAISGASIGKQARQYPSLSLSHHSSPITLDSIFDLSCATSDSGGRVVTSENLCSRPFIL